MSVLQCVGCKCDFLRLLWFCERIRFSFPKGSFCVPTEIPLRCHNDLSGVPNAIFRVTDVALRKFWRDVQPVSVVLSGRSHFCFVISVCQFFLLLSMYFYALPALCVVWQQHFRAVRRLHNPK